MRFSNLIMKLSGSRCEFTLFLIVAGFLYLSEVADGVDDFRRCYNTSVEMHCFAVQYDTNNGPLMTSIDNARQRCHNLNSTLIIIKDEETNNIVQNYTFDPSNPIRFKDVWTDAFRISDFNNSYTWHWVNSKLSNLAVSEVSWLHDFTYYATTLEFRSDNGKSMFYLTAKQPHYSYSFVCEYAVSRCPSTGSNVLQLSDRCYISFSASVSWYEARNWCLKYGGDLASFSNVSSINFTSLLGSVPYSRYWIGLRFTWYVWKDSGADVKFSKWILNRDDWTSPCLVTYYNYADGSFSWLPRDCNIMSNIYVVCHTVTPLQATTLTSSSTTTTASITTPTGNTQLSRTEAISSRNEKSTASSPIALGVGVGVGVGVPAIAAIIVIVICVVRRHQMKTPRSSTTRQESGEEDFHNEYQNNNSEAAEMGHYATVRSVAPSMPPAVEESTSETQYAMLGFKETADLKNGNGQSPLNVL